MSAVPNWLDLSLLGYNEVRHDGTPATRRHVLDLVGPAFELVDDPATERTQILFTGDLGEADIVTTGDLTVGGVSLSLAVGAAAVATTGDLRMRSGGTIVGRTSGDSANRTLVNWRGDDLLEIGSSSAPTRVSGSTSVQAYIGGVQTLSITGVVSSLVPLLVNSGAGTVAGSGDLRLVNGGKINARNNAGDGDLVILAARTDNDIGIGNGGVPNVRIASAVSLLLSCPSLNWGSGTSSPSLRQNSTSTASATGQALTVQAQTTTGTGSVGGALYLMPGDGVLEAGWGHLRSPAGVIDVVSWGGEGDEVVIAAGPLGAERFRADATGIGLFGAPPVGQQADCGAFALPTSITGSDTLDESVIRGIIDSLNSQLNTIRDCLRNLGAMA